MMRPARFVLAAAVVSSAAALVSTAAAEESAGAPVVVQPASRSARDRAAAVAMVMSFFKFISQFLHFVINCIVKAGCYGRVMDMLR